jgi:ABC-2 type transport system ATP-binding protein
MHFGFEQTTVRYGDHIAVRDVTMPVEPGAVTAIVGGDGAGKTTLLRCLAGRKQPSSGRVHRAPRTHAGMLHADDPGYGDLTVDENLRFAATVRGLDHQRFARRRDHLLDTTGLGDARGRLADRLSGGMRRKLGFALATLHEPELLILDEPTTGVDPVSRTDLWRLMTTAAGDGAAIVVATTYLDEAERCSRVLALDEGHVLAHGTPDEIIAAVHGQLYRTDDTSPRPRSWRRGAGRQVWAPDGHAESARPSEPDLEDAVIIAMLARAEDRPLHELEAV